jgi:hypothetical protein
MIEKRMLPSIMVLQRTANFYKTQIGGGNTRIQKKQLHGATAFLQEYNKAFYQCFITRRVVALMPAPCTCNRYIPSARSAALMLISEPLGIAVVV